MRRAARIIGQTALVIAGTIAAALGGAYGGMWVAPSFDRTESSWFWVFFVALPIGLLVGGSGRPAQRRGRDAGSVGPRGSCG